MKSRAPDPTERLRRVLTFEDMFEYLRDELDWPIGMSDLEDATFDWEPSELGIPDERVPQLRRLRQLRPLTASQPWGIFFVEFEGPRLPITPLRRLLQSLVMKKRAIGGGSRRLWNLDDLLFIVTTDSGDSVELHLIAFFEAGGSTPEIRSLPWRPLQSPSRHLKRLAVELLPRLAWPADPSALVDWRTEWREAFMLRHGEPISSAVRLAERMADAATDLRLLIHGLVDDEEGSGPLSDLMQQVRQQLVADVDRARFADMCAQTLVYGVLASRVSDPEAFGASPSLATVPLPNTFLAALFEQVHDEVIDVEVGGSGLELLVSDLRATNVEAMLDQFGSTAKGGDPVIHFYEEFLKRYDREMRADSGAFYTPQPVVSFMVRSVDTLLRAHFELKLGVADPSTWQEVSRRVGFKIPKGVDPVSQFVSMVDPATGTGTFLVEWLRRAQTSFMDEGPNDEWLRHLQGHVIPSMHAFEVMLGPYAVSHLKVALEMHDQGMQPVEMNILLTDTLDHSAPQQTLETMRDPIAVEGQLARRLKEEVRFTVVLGNPPYDREQRRSPQSDGRRKGGVVRHGVPGIKPLLDDVIEPMKTAGLGKHVKNLYNDYVYFWRWATWQATQLPPGPGIVSFITASSYLDGVSMGGLRAHLRQVFDVLWIVDLGGDGRGARTEENVFEIRTPVAIAFGIRKGSSAHQDQCRVFYRRISGTRVEKFQQLAQLALNALDFVEVLGEGLTSFAPGVGSGYGGWPQINDLFPWIHSGCQMKRTWPIGPDPRLLEGRWAALIDAPKAEKDRALRATGFRTAVGSYLPLLSKSGSRLKPIERLKQSDLPEAIERYGYRSFDRQWVIADARLADRPRPDLWAVRGAHQIFLTTLTSTKLGSGPVVTATPYVPDLDHFRGSYGAKNVMPLYRDPDAREPNIVVGLLEYISGRLGLDISAEDLVAYVYSLTGTPAFAEQFDNELAMAAGAVHIPITSDPAMFIRATVLGRELLWLHTWGERFRPDSGREIPSGSAAVKRAIRDYPNTSNYDEANQMLHVGDGVIGPISADVWDFEVSGLKVVSSWLGYRMADRKGKRSSPLDDIRPEHWAFEEELLLLLTILENTVALTPRASDLLAAIVGGPLIEAAELPTASDYERKPPS